MTEENRLTVLNDPKDRVVLFGKEFSADELKNALIDQAVYKQRFKELTGGI